MSLYNTTKKYALLLTLILTAFTANTAEAREIIKEDDQEKKAQTQTIAQIVNQT